MNKIIKELKELKERWRDELDRNTHLRIRVAMTEGSDAPIAIESREELKKSEEKLKHMRVHMFKLIDLLEET